MKPLLCLDFDGVLHSYSSGWQGADVIPDPPVPGAAQFVKDASEHFRIAVFSSRSNQPNGLEAMKTWLDRHLGADLAAVVEWPLEKPAAFVAIDDRALTFDGAWPRIDDLRAFQPWNKR